MENCHERGRIFRLKGGHLRGFLASSDLAFNASRRHCAQSCHSIAIDEIDLATLQYANAAEGLSNCIKITEIQLRKERKDSGVCKWMRKNYTFYSAEIEIDSKTENANHNINNNKIDFLVSFLFLLT